MLEFFNFFEKSVNYWAIIVAAVVAVIIGALWYSPLLFGNVWMRIIKLKETEKRSMLLAYAATFIISLVTAYVLDYFIVKSGEISAWHGVRYGVLAWLGFIVTTHFCAVLFTRYSFKLLLIEASHKLVSFIVIGAILGGWK